MSDDITRTIVRTTIGTGREVFDTGKVVIGIRAQDAIVTGRYETTHRI
jgi:archaeosine-15-forming tRNA-guanine transglycosylase